MLYLPAHGHSR